jgi:hypothetical protein
MKKLCIAILILSSALLYAQNMNPFGNLRHSSVDPEGNLHLRFDSVAEMTDMHQLHYSTSADWQEANLTHLGNGVFEALVPYEFGDHLRYRYTAQIQEMGEAISYLHPAWLQQDIFPVATTSQALIGADPSGDTLQIDSPDLDITASYVAASDARLYRSMENVSGVFPLMQSLTSYNVYMSLLINQDALGDSVAYAMIQTFNIPTVISPGLYKVGADLDMLPTFERLGDIQSTVSENALHMSCLISDLTNDPDFGPWPNATNTLMTTDITLRVGIDLITQEPEVLIADYGTPGIIEFQNLFYEVAENTLPTLTIAHFAELTGTLELLYSDAEGDFPLEATAYIPDGQGGYIYMDMIPVYNPDGTISFFEYAGDNTSFSVSDNLIDYVVLESPPVHNNDMLTPELGAITCRLPNPLYRGSSSCQISFDGLSKEPLYVSLYNLRGQKLKDIITLVPDNSRALFIWDSSAYRDLSQGIYFIKMQQGKHISTHKFTILR